MAIQHADPDQLLTAVRRPPRAQDMAPPERLELAGVQAGLARDRVDGTQARVLLALQRQVGNQAVASLVRHGDRSALPPVQRCGPGGCPDGGCAGPHDQQESPAGLETQMLQRMVVQRGEKWDAFWGVGPIDAWRAKKLSQEALRRAETSGLPGPHNGPADAWRHAYWNCRMTASIGAGQAKEIADNHEKHGGGPAIENAMDQHNNAVGRTCSGDCDTCVQGKLDSGQLRVIDKTGKLVPSTPTGRTPAGAGKDDYKNY